MQKRKYGWNVDDVFSYMWVLNRTVCCVSGWQTCTWILHCSEGVCIPCQEGQQQMLLFHTARECEVLFLQGCSLLCPVITRVNKWNYAYISQVFDFHNQGWPTCLHSTCDHLKEWFKDTVANEVQWIFLIILGVPALIPALPVIVLWCHTRQGQTNLFVFIYFCC